MNFLMRLHGLSRSFCVRYGIASEVLLFEERIADRVHRRRREARRAAFFKFVDESGRTETTLLAARRYV